MCRKAHRNTLEMGLRIFNGSTRIDEPPTRGIVEAVLCVLIKLRRTVTVHDIVRSPGQGFNDLPWSKPRLRRQDQCCSACDLRRRRRGPGEQSPTVVGGGAVAFYTMEFVTGHAVQLRTSRNGQHQILRAWLHSAQTADGRHDHTSEPRTVIAARKV